MDHVVYLDTKAKEFDNLLSGIKNIEEMTPFQFNRDDFKNRMDDWLPVEKIDIVKKSKGRKGK